MRVLIYTIGKRKSEPLQKVFREYGVHSDNCSSEERFCYLAMTDHYAAVLILGESTTNYNEFLVPLHKCRGEGVKLFSIALAQNQSVYQRAKALEGGVDRYHIEPYSYTQLVTEVISQEYLHSIQEESIQRSEVFEINLLTRMAKCRETLLNLTKTEFELLSLFVRRRGMVLSRVQIWEEVWGYEEYPLANTVDVHINRLRKKLPKEARKALRTIYGIGYRLME